MVWFDLFHSYDRLGYHPLRLGGVSSLDLHFPGIGFELVEQPSLQEDAVQGVLRWVHKSKVHLYTNGRSYQKQRNCPCCPLRQHKQV